MKFSLLKLLLMSSRFVAYGLFVQLLCLNLLLASDGKAQKAENVKEVSIFVSYDDASLLKVFSDIESKTAFKFVYDRKDLPADKKISLSASLQSVANVLLEVSQQSELSFQQVNNNINVRKRKKVFADKPVEVVIEQTISGTVTDDESGEPLPGVNVLAKETTSGTVTSADGNYRLTVSDDVAVLVFSSIGYLSKEVNINNRSVIDVNLMPDIQSLSEVVVVGYGTQKAKDVTGAINTADMEAIDEQPNVSFMEGLQGSIPGLNVGQVNEAGESPSISIRGQASLSGEQNPLIVVDQVIYRGSLIDINPSDIESVSVLKDAYATAIYGSQASNGVIMITTKSGTITDGKPVISYSGQYSF